MMMVVAAALELQLGQRVGERGLHQGDFLRRDLFLQAGFGAGAGVFGLLLINRGHVRREDGEDGDALGGDLGATAGDQQAIFLDYRAGR